MVCSTSILYQHQPLLQYSLYQCQLLTLLCHSHVCNCSNNYHLATSAAQTSIQSKQSLQMMIISTSAPQFSAVYNSTAQPVPASATQTSATLRIQTSTPQPVPTSAIQVTMITLLYMIRFCDLLVQVLQDTFFPHRIPLLVTPTPWVLS